MAMADTLRAYLDARGIRYELVSHPPTADSMSTAALAHVPGDRLAKSVVLEDDRGYLLVVLPSTHRLHLGRLHKALHRALGLATESEVERLFADCQRGAVPAAGQAYGVETLVDESLADCPEVYFEAGDHSALVHLSGPEFERLMQGLPHGCYSRHV